MANPAALLALLFPLSPFPLLLHSWEPAGKYSAKLANKSEATAEGLSCRNPVCPFSRDRAEFPGVSPGIPQGLVATQATSVPSSSSGVTTLLLHPPGSHHTPRFASTHWPLSENLIRGCGANKNVPAFLAIFPAVFVQIFAGH